MWLFSKQEKGNDGDVNTLKKGPWSLEEDEKLRVYVSQYGEGNWDAVRKKTELFRCGKSCRLRWLNHLNPNLKKGPITKEEELKIVELHAKIGPKWSLMVQELPGRTDNEIKNFWNIRTRKRTKLGLPLYDHELNDNGETSLNNQEQADVSHEQHSNSFYVSITQPHFSNMLCNNVANTSINNNASPTLTNTNGTPFMTKHTESDLPQHQGCNSKCYKILKELPGRRGNEIDNYHNIRTKKRAKADDEWNDNIGETCLEKTFSDKSDIRGVKFKKDIFSGKDPTILNEINGNNFEDFSNSFYSYSLLHKYPLLPLRSPMEIIRAREK